MRPILNIIIFSAFCWYTSLDSILLVISSEPIQIFIKTPCKYKSLSKTPCTASMHFHYRRPNAFWTHLQTWHCIPQKCSRWSCTLVLQLEHLFAGDFKSVFANLSKSVPVYALSCGLAAAEDVRHYGRFCPFFTAVMLSVCSSVLCSYVWDVRHGRGAGCLLLQNQALLQRLLLAKLLLQLQESQHTGPASGIDCYLFMLFSHVTTC